MWTFPVRPRRRKQIKRPRITRRGPRKGRSVGSRRKADVRTGWLTASISARRNDARDQKWPGTPFCLVVRPPQPLAPSLLLFPVRPAAVAPCVRQVKRSTHNRDGLNGSNYICGRVSAGWRRVVTQRWVGVRVDADWACEAKLLDSNRWTIL